MYKKANYYTVVKSYEDPFNENVQYVLIIENTKIFDYDKRKNKSPYECDLYSHTFYMDINLLKNDKGLDEKEFLFRLMEQAEDVKKKYSYVNEYIGKIYGNTLREVTDILTQYTRVQYSDNYMLNMVGYPYSR